MLKRLLTLTATALLLASCSKDDTQTTAPGADNTVAFTYKSYRTTTRSIATDTERIVRDMDIYAFSGGTLLKHLESGTDYTETDNGDNTTVMLAQEFVSPNTGKSVVFYFVANNLASNAGTERNGQRHIASFNGTEEEFAEALTLALDDSPYYLDGSKSEILAIDPTAGGMLMTGRSAAVRLVGKSTATVTLKRRVARFDVVNPVPDKFTIENIYISTAPVQGPLFAEAKNTPAIATRGIEPLGIIPQASYDAKGRAAAVFYLYPTDMTTTKIAVEGFFGGDPTTSTLFEVEGTTDIIANKRYTLIFDEDNLKFTAGVGDWDEL